MRKIPDKTRRLAEKVIDNALKELSEMKYNGPAAEVRTKAASTAILTALKVLN
ncbi:MAG: hypothetical protein ACI4LC_06035 [Emergencia sp.]